MWRKYREAAVHGNILLSGMVRNGEKAVPGSGKLHLDGPHPDDADRSTGQAPSAGRKGCVYRTVRGKEARNNASDVRSEVDFVLTFEEMTGIFAARHIDVENLKEDPHGINDASTDGRNFAVSGGVAKAVVNVINEKYPDREIKVANAEGLRRLPQAADGRKAGKYNGYLLEGMACPGGCVAGAGTMQSIKKSAAVVGMYAKQAEHQTATGTHHVAELDKLVD